MNDVVFCESCMQNMGMEPIADRAWNKRSLTWYLQTGLPGIALEALATTVAKSFKWWTDVCMLTAARVTDINEADIRMRVTRIDGPRGVLGRSMLPPAFPILQDYDSSEDWVNDIPPDLVFAHELGHGLGLQHDGRTGALMSPSLNKSIRGLTERDVQRIQALYGVRTVPPPVPDDDVARRMIVFNASGRELARYRLEWEPTPAGALQL